MTDNLAKCWGGRDPGGHDVKTPLAGKMQKATPTSISGLVQGWFFLPFTFARQVDDRCLFWANTTVRYGRFKKKKPA